MAGDWSERRVGGGSGGREKAEQRQSAVRGKRGQGPNHATLCSAAQRRGPGGSLLGPATAAPGRWLAAAVNVSVMVGGVGAVEEEEDRSTGGAAVSRAGKRLRAEPRLVQGRDEQGSQRWRGVCTLQLLPP